MIVYYYQFIKSILNYENLIKTNNDQGDEIANKFNQSVMKYQCEM